MSHHLVGFYQNTSKYGPGVEIKPMLWGLGFHIEIEKENFENLLVPNLCFDIWYVASCDLYQVCSYGAPGLKTGLPQGSQVGT